MQLWIRRQTWGCQVRLTGVNCGANAPDAVPALALSSSCSCSSQPWGPGFLPGGPDLTSLPARSVQGRAGETLGSLFQCQGSADPSGPDSTPRALPTQHQEKSVASKSGTLLPRGAAL